MRVTTGHGEYHLSVPTTTRQGTLAGSVVHVLRWVIPQLIHLHLSSTWNLRKEPYGENLLVDLKIWSCVFQCDANRFALRPWYNATEAMAPPETKESSNQLNIGCGDEDDKRLGGDTNHD